MLIHGKRGGGAGAGSGSGSGTDTDTDASDNEARQLSRDLKRLARDKQLTMAVSEREPGRGGDEAGVGTRQGWGPEEWRPGWRPGRGDQVGAGTRQGDQAGVETGQGRAPGRDRDQARGTSQRFRLS